MNDFWKDSPGLAARLDRIGSVMDGAIRVPGFALAGAVASMAASNGKMLRPALLVIGSEFGKPTDDERIDSLAAALELLHVATLIHDDVLDEADLRRGLPTLHTKLGTKTAILAGDWLFSRCFRLAADSAGPDHARALARLIGAVCEAEISQDMQKFTYDASPRQYFRLIAGKTAALFSLALHTGATEAKAPAKIAQSLRRAGYNIGMAFQVIDDILDCEATSRVMRKSVGKDVKEGLCTLPLIYALIRDRPCLEPLLSRRPLDDQAAEAVAALVAELGGIARARADAQRFTLRAQVEIGRLPRCTAREELAAMTERLLIREY
jgi:heptaprenyl diphosphate synthase